MNSAWVEIRWLRTSTGEAPSDEQKARNPSRTKDSGELEEGDEDGLAIEVAVSLGPGLCFRLLIGGETTRCGYRCKGV